ncbi:MAG: hypothetical protein V3U65_14645 [Granulosicoccaceae bacterium]
MTDYVRVLRIEKRRNMLMKWLGVLLVPMMVLPSNVKANKLCVAISNGSNIQIVTLNDQGSLVQTSELRFEGLTNTVWPTYNNYIGKLIFGADENGESGIYIASGVKENRKVEILVRGRLPAQSQNGEYLAYINTQGVLEIYDFRSKVTHAMTGAAITSSVWGRVTWFGSNNVVYTDEKGSLIKYDIISRIFEVIPSSIVYPVGSNNNGIYFIDEDGMEISFYDYKAKRFSSILKSRFLTIAPSIMYLNELNGFVFAQQTWRDTLRLSTRKSLQFFDYDSRKRTVLMENSTFFGGTKLPC